MTYDGIILSRVRQAIAAEKAKNEAELERRRSEVFARCPDIRAIDTRIARLMTGVITGALRTGSNAGAAVLSARRDCEELLCQKRSLLSSLGLPTDYLDEIYTCQSCRDTGYILGKPCACLSARCKAESARELSSMLDLRGQSFESFDLSHYSAEGGDNSPRAVMTAVYDYCRKYAGSFSEASGNLLFSGGTGLGKTFLSASIAKVVADSGFSVCYNTAVSVFDAFETQKFDRGGESAEEVNSQVRRYLSCDLLILDDLGTEMTTTFTNSALYTIINSRLVSGKSTIISTNLSRDALALRYSKQIVSRLLGEYSIFIFAGEDYRISDEQ